MKDDLLDNVVDGFTLLSLIRYLLDKSEGLERNDNAFIVAKRLLEERQAEIADHREGKQKSPAVRREVETPSTKFDPIDLAFHGSLSQQAGISGWLIVFGITIFISVFVLAAKLAFINDYMAIIFALSLVSISNLFFRKKRVFSRRSIYTILLLSFTI